MRSGMGVVAVKVVYGFPLQKNVVQSKETNVMDVG